MTNRIAEIVKAAEADRVEAKLASLEKEPFELYEIVDKIMVLAKKNKYEEIAQVPNYDFFNMFFCINNDLMALMQVGQLQYFDTSASYDELYSVTAESADYINTWTFKTHYEYIRRILDAKSQAEVIGVCQTLGLSPYFINYDIQQSFVAMSNFLFYKQRIEEIKKSNKTPSLQRSEMRKAYADFLQETINILNTRFKETRKFYKTRKENCEAKIKCAKDLIEKADNGELQTLDLIEGEWHQLLDPSVLTPLYELLIDNQRDRHNRVTSEHNTLTNQINETPFIAYLYKNKINPLSLQEDLLIKANSIPFEELEQKINFFLKLSISLQDLLMLHIHYLFNTELSTINKFNFYIDQDIIKKQTIKEDLSILDKLNIINTNYSILKNIIDITSPYYSDKVLLLPTSEIKRRLSILGQYDLSINNYMFLLTNFNYINIYDLLIENKIPTYLFISICKTEDPLLTIKKIMISQELNIPYENNGRLVKEIRNVNAFMCSNEDIDEYIDDTVSEYMIGNITRSPIETVLKHPLVIQLDSSHRYGETYMFGKTRISRPKVLSKLQTFLNKKQDINNYLLFCILSESILNDRNIAEIKNATSKKTIH